MRNDQPYAALSNLSVYCLGDYIRDVWQDVDVTKITPDAPAPVWREFSFPITAAGGAGNVAEQFRFLSNDVTLGTLSNLLVMEDEKTGPNAVKTIVERNPRGDTIKKRIVSHGHILARIDTLKNFFRSEAKCEELAIKVINKLAKELASNFVKDGISGKTGRRVVAVLSDYGLGFWTRKTAALANIVFFNHGVPTVVDPKHTSRGGAPLDAWAGATILKLNMSELNEYAGDGVDNGVAIANRLKTTVVVTRGHEPPTIINAKDAQRVNETGKRYSIDRPLWASGAGDCFAAYLAANLTPSITPSALAEVVKLAHAAGACYVEKPYNTPVHPREAGDKCGYPNPKVYIDPGELASRITALPVGSRIGYTNGCFDLLHAGHISCLQWSRQQCDFLVVFLNSDTSYEQNRGKKPIGSFRERAACLAALEPVSAVIGFDEPTPREAFAKVGRCDVLIKGTEYQGEPLAGQEYAENVAFAPEVVPVHTREIIRRIRGA